MDTVLGLVLVVTTGYYAWQTRRLIVEMERCRTAGEQAQRRLRSEDAALRALLALRPASQLHADELLARSVCQQLHAALEAEAALIEDGIVRDRVRAASIVTATAAVEEELAGRDRELAMLHSRLLLDATRHTLECYLTGGFLPDWRNLPSAVDARDWLRASAQAGDRPTT